MVAGMFAPAAFAREEVVVAYKQSTSEARLLDFTPAVAPRPLSVDIKVIGKRIHRKIVLSNEEFLQRKVGNNYAATLDNLRSYTVYVTSGIYDCDLIVGARFSFEITNNGAVVEIFGYPANFVNWGGNGEELPEAKEVNPNYGNN